MIEKRSKTDRYDREGCSNKPLEGEPASRVSASNWPLILLFVGFVVLFVAGGYLIQQRAASQDDLGRLQRALDISANPSELIATKVALHELEQQTAEKIVTIRVLRLYNKRLTDVVAALEQQLAVQQGKVTGLSDAEKVIAVESTAKPNAESMAAEVAEKRAAPVVANDSE